MKNKEQPSSTTGEKDATEPDFSERFELWRRRDSIRDALDVTKEALKKTQLDKTGTLYH